MKRIAPIIILVLLILPSIFGLLHTGFFLTDDGNSMVIRLSAFYNALRYGQFPVRFLPGINFGYGYPVADFLYPMFLYIGVPIHVVGFNFVSTIKIILGISLLTSGIFTYFWLRKMFSTIAAIVGGVFYVLFPYHLWDTYKRGSVGEVLALAVVPFIFWQIERKNLLLASLGIAVLILSHNVLALFFLPILFLYAILFKKFSIYALFGVYILGLGISAFFWAPALLDRSYTIFDKTIVSNFTDYFVIPGQYYLLGFAFLGVLIQTCLYLKKILGEKMYMFFLILTIFSVFLALPISQFLWQFFPEKNLIQFPFRLLSITELSTSFLLAYSISTLKKPYVFIISAICIVLIYFSASNLVFPKIITNYPDSFYSTNLDSTTTKAEYTPVWVKKLPTSLPQEKIVINKQVGTVSNVTQQGTKLTMSAAMQKLSTVHINIEYFPGWKVFVDGKDTKIYYDNPTGTMQFNLAKGNHFIVVQFGETPANLSWDIVSIICFIILIGIGVLGKKKYAKV